MQSNDIPWVTSLENPKFVTYMIVCALLVLKMWWLTVLTVMKRMKHKVVMNEEDTKVDGFTVGSHSDVERVQRAFQNDLENIPAFLFIALAYLWVSVPSWVVHFLYYLFFIARLGHSIVYAVVPIGPPTRCICFVIGFFIVTYMSLHVLIAGIAAYCKN
ncbi:microsomal glutathione S-transferase 1-like [Sitophilus oryzae]|uniref:Microsomal glutathione S-transferase 1 n=1 Tax=Sitophilus oryzae TaxID=7048 RepID=A0A6J2YIM7_SITOR|nr:microsomal glutathione S-transferase 1-like [Sitophilus oryzae]